MKTSVESNYAPPITGEQGPLEECPLALHPSVRGAIYDCDGGQRGQGVGLLSHYLKIAVRNLSKYKVQNVVCVLSIAVSAMLLVVIGSMMRELRPAEIMEQPYADRTVEVGFWTKGDNDVLIANPTFAKIAEGICAKYSERVFPTSSNHYSGILTATVDNREVSCITRSFEMQGDFLRWWGARSEVTGKECAIVNNGEAILSDKMARQLFGKADVIGQTVYATFAADSTRERHQLRIVDVVRLSAYSSFVIGDGIFVNSSLHANNAETTHYCLQLREGVTKQTLERELDELRQRENLDNAYYMITRMSDRYAEVDTYMMPLRNGTVAFLIIFLAISVIGYMRMQAQLFRIRQREIALRTVVGARRWQLLVQFSVEVLLILAIAMSLTLALNTLVRDYLTENIAFILSELYWPMDNFTQLTLWTYAATAVLCLVVVALVIRGIRRRQTGLALQMRPSRGSAMSVATMSVQLFFSTFFMAVIITRFSYIHAKSKEMDVPDNDSYYKRCILVRNYDYRSQESLRQMIDMVERSSNVEKVVELSTAGDIVPIDTVAEPTEDSRKYVIIEFQKNNEVLDFYDIKPVVTNPNANPSQCVYVPEELMNDMKKGGTWQRGYIDLMMTRYDIAGYYGKLHYNRNNQQPTIIATDPNRDGYIDNVFIAAKPFRYSAAMRDVRAAAKEAFHDIYSTVEVLNYRNTVAQEWQILEVINNIFLIIAAISITTTIASIYSVVSLDTRRRRKEVALRKVHGATPWIIARMFARRYIVICAVCFALLLPMLLLLFSINDGVARSEFHIEWWQVWCGTAVAITAIVFLTIAWRIRDVMHLNPADWLKE